MASFGMDPADDFRVAYLYEARECLRQWRKQTIDQPEYWANLLGGLFNATVAAVSDSVALGLTVSDRQQQADMAAVREHILDKLDAG